MYIILYDDIYISRSLYIYIYIYIYSIYIYIYTIMRVVMYNSVSKAQVTKLTKLNVSRP